MISKPTQAVLDYVFTKTKGMLWKGAVRDIKLLLWVRQWQQQSFAPHSVRVSYYVLGGNVPSTDLQELQHLSG